MRVYEFLLENKMGYVVRDDLIVYHRLITYQVPGITYHQVYAQREVGRYQGVITGVGGITTHSHSRAERLLRMVLRAVLTLTWLLMSHQSFETPMEPIIGTPRAGTEHAP